MVSFEEARAYWEISLHRVDAALEKAALDGRVPVREIAALNQAHADYQTHLGHQRDPYREFQEAQSCLLAVAPKKQHGTPEGLKAYAEFLHNEVNPAQVGGGELGSQCLSSDWS